MSKRYCGECDEMHPASFYCTYAADAAKARIKEKSMPPMVGQKVTRVHVPIESIEDRNVLQQYSAMEMAMIGAQGASPPEPAKGMNGPTGAPQWGCDPGSGEIWITGDNTIAREVGESQSYVSRDGAALSRAPEIPVTDEMIRAVRRRAMCPGWTDNVVAEFYRLMRAKEPGAGDAGEYWAERWHETNLEREAALARAEAAELARDDAWAENQEWCEINKSLAGMRDDWKNRALAAETRLAERDASFNRLRFRK